VELLEPEMSQKCSGTSGTSLELGNVLELVWNHLTLDPAGLVQELANSIIVRKL